MTEAKLKNVYFLGIGGIGMRGLAKYLLEDGHIVTGSDIEDSKYTDANGKTRNIAARDSTEYKYGILGFSQNGHPYEAQSETSEVLQAYNSTGNKLKTDQKMEAAISAGVFPVKKLATPQVTDGKDVQALTEFVEPKKK